MNRAAPSARQAIGLKTQCAVFAESDVGARRQRDAVIVVQANELAQAQMAGQRCGLGGHTFHQVAVADERPGAVVYGCVAALVVARRQMRFGDRHADRVRQALAQRAGRDLYARRIASLRVAGCLLPHWRNCFRSASDRS